MTDYLFLLMAYFPVVSLVVGIISLSVYFILRFIKKRIHNWLLVLGFIGIGITLFIYSAFFIIGFMGLGPVAS